jgi:hypothetical protein
VLRGGAGLFTTSNSIERNKFKQYVALLDLTNDFSGVQVWASLSHRSVS